MEANKSTSARPHSQILRCPDLLVQSTVEWFILTRHSCSCGWRTSASKLMLVLCCLRPPSLQVDKSQPVVPSTPRRHLDKPAKLRPWNALPDMECLFNIFSVTVTLHVNDILHTYTQYIACWQLPIFLFESCFSEIHVFKFDFVAHK